ncbi:MAG: hypothetical protein DI585_04005 [Pseudomonas fluorescens]|nr:MAG: hypothetical protein DI585_04005 [Pseudomonas fluorescens]
MPISSILSRRAFLSGAMAVLATPYLSTPAHAVGPSLKRRINHVRTAIDHSSSFNGTLHKNLMSAFADVVQTDLGSIIEQSSFDEIIFEVNYWGSFKTSLIKPVTLVTGNCKEQLNQIAAQLYTEAETNGGKEGTNLGLCMEDNLKDFSPSASQTTLNIVTDDDSSRTDNFILAFHQQKAQEQNTRINGLIVGSPEALNGYFPKYVQTGPGSFTLPTENFNSLRAAWRQKFIQDLF